MRPLHRHHPGPARRPKRAGQTGFTLIELLCAMAISAVLAGLSLPSFQQTVLKTRRVDGWSALMHLQLAQERHRANHLSYGTLAALQQTTTSPSGHYLLSVSHLTANGYRLLAQAQGGQHNDKACRYLQLRVDGLNHVKESGRTPALGNNSTENRACWAL